MLRRGFLSGFCTVLCAQNGDSELDFARLIRPVPKTAVLRDERYYIWCGAPIRSDDGRYHLYYSRWPRELGHNAWVTHSEIAHAVSDQPWGPYKHRDVALPARGKQHWDGHCTHNPNIVRAGKRYCLFYMGNTGDGVATKALNMLHRNHQRIGVAIADNPNGPWKRFDQPAIDVNPDKSAFDSLMTSNPGAAVRPDGGMLVVYKGVIDNGSRNGGQVRYGVVTADKPEGPYVRHPGTIFEAKDAGDGKHWMLAEDPYAWYGKDRYYAITRDVIGRFTGASGGLALFESRDGFDWKPARHPKVLGADFEWEDGSHSGVRLERPALLFDEKQRPIGLFGAYDHVVDKVRVHAWNVHVPLRAV
jgi:hypothetical protein